MNFPPYKSFPVLSNESITLRKVSNADLIDLIEISFYDAVQAKSIDDAVIMNNKIELNYLDGESIHWGIAINNSNAIVGTCGFYRGFDQRTGELGCVLLPKYYGQGIMTMALQLAIQFGFNEIGLSRILAITTKENLKAIKLLERLGFEKTIELDGNQIEFELITSKQSK